MRTLYLHIGFHKTGSSSIQLSLQENQEKLKKYDWEFISSHKSGNSSDCVIVKNKFTWIEYKISPKLYDLIGQSTGKNVVLSAEHLCFVTDPNELRKLYEFISTKFDTIKVVACLRRQDKLAKSFKDQAAKTVTYKSNPASILCGHSPEPLPELTPAVIEYFDFYNKLHRWADIFGLKNLIAFDFDQAVKHKDGICGHFSELVSLPFKLPEIIVNESVNKETGSLWHILNQLGFNSEDLKNLKLIVKSNSKDRKEYIPGSKEFLDFFSKSNLDLYDFLDNTLVFSQDFPEEKNKITNSVNVKKLAHALNIKEYGVSFDNVVEELKKISFDLEKKQQFKQALDVISLALKIRPNGNIIKQHSDFLKRLIDKKHESIILSDRERINYYFKSSKKLTEERLLKLPLRFNYDSPVRYKKEIFSDIESGYIKDMEEIFKTIPDDVSIPVQFGDKTNNLNANVFCKARNIGDEQSILLKINKGRHFSVNPRPLDIVWKNKKGEVVWRGASTGYDTSREKFVVQYNDKYNIGFSKVVQGKNIPEQFIKGPLTVSEQLKYKYIVSLEGNDVASNLKWILASNSVPIMKKPTKESWAMEGLLEPYIHYLPLSEDGSNLSELLEWAEENDEQCEEIAFNGKVFMTQFSDEERELDIQRKMILQYNEVSYN